MSTNLTTRANRAPWKLDDARAAMQAAGRDVLACTEALETGPESSAMATDWSALAGRVAASERSRADREAEGQASQLASDAALLKTRTATLESSLADWAGHLEQIYAKRRLTDWHRWTSAWL